MSIPHSFDPMGTAGGGLPAWFKRGLIDLWTGGTATYMGQPVTKSGNRDTANTMTSKNIAGQHVKSVVFFSSGERPVSMYNAPCCGYFLDGKGFLQHFYYVDNVLFQNVGCFKDAEPVSATASKRLQKGGNINSAIFTACLSGRLDVRENYKLILNDTLITSAGTNVTGATLPPNGDLMWRHAKKIAFWDYEMTEDELQQAKIYMSKIK